MTKSDYKKLKIGDKVTVINGEEYSHFKNGSVVTANWIDKYEHIVFEAEDGTRQYLLSEHIERYESN